MAITNIGQTGPESAQMAFDQMADNARKNADYARQFLFESAQTSLDINSKKFAFNMAVKSRLEGSSAYYKLIDEAIKKSGGAGG
jgi:hypothetical protein